LTGGRETREGAFMTEPARSIGKLGFRKWYERRLIESHAWLITCFLCALGIAASLEGLSFKRSYPKMNVRCRKFGRQLDG
jgi:hypothetical protein